MLHESLFGDETRSPKNSALSGKPLDFGAGDVAITINGYRLGITALEYRQATQAEIDAAKAMWAEQLPAAKASKPVIADVDYEAQTLDDLKALAKTRKVDLTGKSSKAAIVSVLRFADLQARVTDTSNVSEDAAPFGMIGE